MTPTFIDVECLQGNWNLAAIRQGFHCVARKSYGFGDECIRANYPILGTIPTQTTQSQSEWDPCKADAIFGTPPCAGWSGLNVVQEGPNKRGIDSATHNFTWDVIHYAARCKGSDGKKGPQFVAFESVQGAFKEGRSLMHRYLEYLNAMTYQGPRYLYKLAHVLMSGASVGAAAERKRYFWVAHRVPFGVDIVAGKRPVTVRERIHDLENEPLSWSNNSHMVPNNEKARLVVEVMKRTGWKPGLRLRDASRMLLNRGELPRGAERWFTHDGIWKSFGGPYIPHPDRPAPVISGGSAAEFLHYKERRFWTVREMARIMGLPDDWKIPTESVVKAVTWLGKNAPVESLEWISKWIRRSLEGDPGPINGSGNGGVIDVTYAWKGKHKIKGWDVDYGLEVA